MNNKLIMNKKFKLKIISLSALFLFFCGCEEVDDQSIARDKEWVAANPKPIKRNFLENNRRHEILMAVIDSGVDYNQPYLINNIHFDLNNENIPNSFGYDFTGEDQWASPYLARTRDLNPEADPEEKLTTKMARTNSFNIVSTHPELATFLDPSRNTEQEISAHAFHGTHVAGLMVYDEPRLGLISYRVLPINVKYKLGKKDPTSNSTKTVYNEVVQAMELAIKAGARVINMSLALRDNPKDNLMGILLDEENNYRLWINQVKVFMEKHPDVVFVAAAGNENSWVDDKVNLQIPCGINALNLICVGSLDKNGNLSKFSNIVLSSAAFVATEGEDIFSTLPSLMCDSEFFHYLDKDKKSYPFQDLKFLESEINKFRSDCKKNNHLIKLSGTNMASPIVARVAAKILLQNPEYSAVQVIQKIIEDSDKLKLGPLTLNRVPFEKPSWYKNIQHLY